MTITACGDEYTEEDKKALDEAAKGYDSKMTQEVWGKFLEEHMPEVERAIHNDSIRCLENHAENARETINQKLSQQSEITDLDKLDREVWPTHQQLDEMVKVGEELGVDETEIIRTPLICATPGVEIVEELIYDMMWALHTQDRIPPWYRDDKVFTKIMFVDARPEGITGPKVADFNPVTRTLHIYRKTDGDFPTKEELRDKILPHEVFHANKHEFMQIINAHKDEWKTVTLFEMRAPSTYVTALEEAYIKGKITKEEREEEIAAEWYRRYIANECSERTTNFFDKYFSE